jgi:hypothetical protein
VHQFEITPKALANCSPRLQRSDNLGIDHKIVIELKGFATRQIPSGLIDGGMA